MKKFQAINDDLLSLTEEWEPILLDLDESVITDRRNSQSRNIKQIIGHMIDSASNNTHRIVHLQYQKCPFLFPNYATHGNNDRWIAIQNYQEEDWHHLIQLWKYSNYHIAHIMLNVDPDKLENMWIADEKENKMTSLEDMIVDYLRHFKLHLNEITELMNRN